MRGPDPRNPRSPGPAGTANDRPPRRNPPRNRFVVAPPPAAAPAAPPPSHAALAESSFTGVLRLEIETLSPLFTAGGHFVIKEGMAMKAPLERSGQPVVAGSSIKGACRQLHEVLTGSGDPFRQGGGPSSVLFGSLGQAARLSFDDAVPASQLPDGAPGPTGADVQPLKGIRLSTAYPPGKGGTQGRRFYGRIPPGADQPPRLAAMAFRERIFLATLLRFHNVSQEEIGSVLMALGLAPEYPFTPRLGAGKFDTFGWTRFHLSAYRRWQGLGRSGEWVVAKDSLDAFRAAAVRTFLVSPPRGLAEFQNQIVAHLQGPDGGGR